MNTPHNMPAPSATQLAGLEYAYMLWMEVEHENDNGHGEWLNFSEQMELAIMLARKAANKAQP